jgi:hypothetical protein
MSGQLDGMSGQLAMRGEQGCFVNWGNASRRGTGNSNVESFAHESCHGKAPRRPQPKHLSFPP